MTDFGLLQKVNDKRAAKKFFFFTWKLSISKVPAKNWQFLNSFGPRPRRPRFFGVHSKSLGTCIFMMFNLISILRSGHFLRSFA